MIMTPKHFIIKTNVKIHIRDFGGTSAVEHLIPGFFFDRKDYFPGKVDYFERGKSIRVAPYDWRLAVGMSVCVVVQIYMQ